MRFATSLCLIGCLAAGCGGARGGSSAPPPFNPPGPDGATTYQILPGQSTIIDASDPGFGITTSADGTQWRIVWTGNSGRDYSDFRGYVFTPGHFATVTPGCSDGSCALESGDVLNQPVSVAGGGEEIDFDTVALDGFDGFDFTVDTEPVVFYLETQYTAYTGTVFFTDASSNTVVNPGTMPFGLVTQ